VSEISYADAPVPIRSDLPEAHRRAWDGLAAPGAWWSGAERVAIAVAVREARRCPLCRERRRSGAPDPASGRHAGAAPLPEAALEAVHRLATDPGRVDRAWFDRVRAAGIDEGHYVELLGVVATVVSIDGFCRALGVPLHPLPEPGPGAPSGYRPAGLRDEGAWVPMLPNGRPSGPEADLWSTLRTGNVVRALSLVPDEVRTLGVLSAAHYLRVEEVVDPTAGRGALDRGQMELVAGRVSALHECFY
jgi:hypothetical protein